MSLASCDEADELRTSNHAVEGDEVETCFDRICQAVSAPGELLNLASPLNVLTLGGTVSVPGNLGGTMSVAGNGVCPRSIEVQADQTAVSVPVGAVELLGPLFGVVWLFVGVCPRTARASINGEPH